MQEHISIPITKKIEFRVNYTSPWAAPPLPWCLKLMLSATSITCLHSALLSTPSTYKLQYTPVLDMHNTCEGCLQGCQARLVKHDDTPLLDDPALIVLRPATKTPSLSLEAAPNLFLSLLLRSLDLHSLGSHARVTTLR